MSSGFFLLLVTYAIAEFVCQIVKPQAAQYLAHLNFVRVLQDGSMVSQDTLRRQENIFPPLLSNFLGFGVLECMNPSHQSDF
jgi:hypothetical protein